MRALSSSLYKDTAFSREIQIALTFRNTLGNVKMQRFATDGPRRVLYYEARTTGWLAQGRVRARRRRVDHCFRRGTGGAGLADGNFFR